MYKNQLCKSKVHNFLKNTTYGSKEWFDMEQIDIKEPFPVTNLPFTS